MIDITRRAINSIYMSHCGIYGNEERDILAKLDAKDQQEQNQVSFQEMKTMIKSLFRQPQPSDSYHQLSRPDQVVIFRLRTGHNRLNHHLHRKMQQTKEHILQECRNLRSLREELWPRPVPLQDKLHGPVETLQKTTSFISRAEL